MTEDSRLTTDRYIAGGCFLVKSVARPEWLSADLLPERILSLSACLCPSVQITWGWYDEQQADALDFGVTADRLADLRTWSLGEGIDFPNVFLSLSAARQFAQDFLPAPDHVHLLGIGLPRDLVDDFLARPQYVHDALSGESRPQRYGVSRVVAERQPPAPEGTPLGFEVLSYDHNLGHSWLCSGLERDMQQLFGIRPNPHGFIDTEAQAMQVYRWIAEDEQRGTRAEPEPYYPWLIVDYPLHP